MSEVSQNEHDEERDAWNRRHGVDGGRMLPRDEHRAGEGGHVPVSDAPRRPACPPYYRPLRSNPRMAPDFETADFINAFQLGHNGGEVVCHVVRAGRKPAESAVEAWEKVVAHALLGLEFARAQEARSQTLARNPREDLGEIIFRATWRGEGPIR